MDVEGKKLHQRIGKLLDDEIPISSQFYTDFSNFACVYLSANQLADSAKPSRIFQYLESGKYIGVGNYKVLLDMLEQSKLINLMTKVEDIAKGIPSNSASAAASTDSPQPANQLSNNPSQQSRQNLVFKIIQKGAIRYWRDLGRELGVENSAIDSIILDYANNVQEQCYQMLLRWRQTQSADRGTPEVLVEALGRIDCNSVVDEIKECLMQYTMKKPFDE